MSFNRAKSGAPLPPAEAEKLRELLQAKGLPDVLYMCTVSTTTIMRAAAGFPLTLGMRRLILDGIHKMTKVSKTEAA
jgi:hypothetical protein